VELGKHLGKGIWGLADKALPVVYGFGYVLLVIRVLPEEEFGNFVLLQEVFLIISGLATAFALQPLLKYAAEDQVDIASVVTTALWMNLAFILVSSAAVVALSGPVGVILHSPSLSPLLLYVPAMLAASFIRNFTLFLLQTRFRIQEVFWVDAVHFLGAPLLVWVYSRMHFFDSALDLVVINIISLSASSLTGLALARSMIRFTVSPHLEDQRKMWKYGTYSLGGIVSYLAYTKADTFILAAFTGPIQVAVYNSAKVFTRVYDMANQVVQMFVLPAVSRLSSQGEFQRLKALVEKAIMFSTVGMIPVFLLLLLGPSLLVQILYSGRYAGAIPILQVLSLLSLVIPLLAVGSNTLLGLGHARLNFLIGLQMLAISIAAYFVLVPRLGPIGAAIGYVVATYIITWITTLKLHQLQPLSARAVLSRLNDITHFLKSRLG
jgi:O-antigen/teichoic acid export membrane protein